MPPPDATSGTIFVPQNPKGSVLMGYGENPKETVSILLEPNVGKNASSLFDEDEEKSGPFNLFKKGNSKPQEVCETRTGDAFDKIAIIVNDIDKATAQVGPEVRTILVALSGRSSLVKRSLRKLFVTGWKGAFQRGSSRHWHEGRCN